MRMWTSMMVSALPSAARSPVSPFDFIHERHLTSTRCGVDLILSRSLPCTTRRARCSVEKRLSWPDARCAACETVHLRRRLVADIARQVGRWRMQHLRGHPCSPLPARRHLAVRGEPRSHGIVDDRAEINAEVICEV